MQWKFYNYDSASGEGWETQRNGTILLRKKMKLTGKSDSWLHITALRDDKESEIGAGSRNIQTAINDKIDLLSMYG